MEKLILFLVVVSMMICWVLAGVKSQENGRLMPFFGHLGLCLGCIAAFFGILVVPVLNCSGTFCGLGEILTFIIATYLIVFIWGIVLLITANSRSKRLNSGSEAVVSKRNDLDHDFETKYEEF